MSPRRKRVRRLWRRDRKRGFVASLKTWARHVAACDIGHESHDGQAARDWLRAKGCRP